MTAPLSLPLEEKIRMLHQAACEQQQDFYLDPKSGYRVFTEDYLKNRGTCCKSGCRHCPFDFPKGKSKGP